MAITGAGSKESIIGSEINCLRNAVSAMEEAIDCLQERLNPLMLPHEKNLVNSVPVEQPDRERCQIDLAIFEINNKMENQTERIRSITRELQV